jgi:hypothetical protein
MHRTWIVPRPWVSKILPERGKNCCKTNGHVNFDLNRTQRAEWHNTRNASIYVHAASAWRPGIATRVYKAKYMLLHLRIVGHVHHRFAKSIATAKFLEGMEIESCVEILIDPALGFCSTGNRVRLPSSWARGPLKGDTVSMQTQSTTRDTHLGPRNC